MCPALRGTLQTVFCRRSLAFLIAMLAASTGSRTASADVFSDIALRVYLGARVFSADSALGNQPEGGTAIAHGAVLGLRAIYDLNRWIAIEGEVPATLTNSRDDLATLLFIDPRAHVKLAAWDIADGRFIPFAVLGLGIPFVLSDNQSGLESDILGEFYGGAGIALEPEVGALAVRFDTRLEVIQSRADQPLIPELEFLVTIYRAGPRRWKDSDEKVLIDAPKPPPDADGDGIPDETDKCPNRDEDIDKFEDEDGCPDIDNDMDRVLDIADKCPSQQETLNGLQDEDGCPDVLPQELVNLDGTLGVRFATGTSKLAGNSFAILRRVAKVLGKYPTVNVEIGGHTDNRGDEDANQALSQARAEAVVDYLALQGIERSRLRPVGYGPFNPIASNDTPSGRLQNRRVEFRVIKPKLPDQKLKP